MNYYLTIPVLNDKKPLSLKLLYAYGVAVFIYGGFSIQFEDLPKLLLFIGMVSIIVFMIFIKKPFYKIGHLVLKEDEIQYVTKDNQITFPIDELGDLRLKYMGYVGRGDLLARGFTSGIGSSLKFTFEDHDHHFSLKFYQEHMGLMQKIIDVWRRKEVKVKVKTGFFMNDIK